MNTFMLLHYWLRQRYSSVHAFSDTFIDYDLFILQNVEILVKSQRDSRSLSFLFVPKIPACEWPHRFFRSVEKLLLWFTSSDDLYRHLAHQIRKRRCTSVYAHAFTIVISGAVLVQVCPIHKLHEIKQDGAEKIRTTPVKVSSLSRQNQFCDAVVCGSTVYELHNGCQRPRIFHDSSQAIRCHSVSFCVSVIVCRCVCVLGKGWQHVCHPYLCARVCVCLCISTLMYVLTDSGSIRSRIVAA